MLEALEKNLMVGAFMHQSCLWHIALNTVASLIANFATPLRSSSKSPESKGYNVAYSIGFISTNPGRAGGKVAITGVAGDEEDEEEEEEEEEGSPAAAGESEEDDDDDDDCAALLLLEATSAAASAFRTSTGGRVHFAGGHCTTVSPSKAWRVWRMPATM